MRRPDRVHEAGAELRGILRRVKHGRCVTIADRGRAVARLVPIGPTHDLDAQLDGIVIPGNGRVATIRPLTRKPSALRRFLKSRA